jgi:hypothetical protein
LLKDTVLSGGIIKFTPHTPDLVPEDCGEDFHLYWNWEMGGKKIYKPATDAEKEDGRKNNGSVLSDNNDYTSVSSGLKETLDGGVYILDQNSTPSTGWFIDKETGWALWGGFLMPGQATSLLLHRVTRTSVPIPDDYYYAINVEARMWDIPVSLDAASISPQEQPDDILSLIYGIGVEKPSDDALSFLKKIFIQAADEGAFGEDVAGSKETIDEIFALDEEPPAIN